MPRPTPAQLACGALTVVFSTLAMLALSQARSGTGVVVIAVVALTLGLLVAVGLPVLHSAHASRAARGSLTVAYGNRAAAPTVPFPPAGGEAPGGGHRVPQTSLHR